MRHHVAWLARSRVMSSPSPPRFAVLVPLKRTAVAKTRLATLGDDARRLLVAAFAADTVSAALESPLVEVVVAVTDDLELASALGDLGAQVMPDGVTDDLNGSLVQAAAEVRRRWPGLSVAALCADLPALRPTELTEALAAAATRPVAFVGDQAGSGTTLFTAGPGTPFEPAFGEGSRARHLEQGAWEVAGVELPTVRQDVDTPADLEAVLALGVGSRTSQAVAGLRL